MIELQEPATQEKTANDSTHPSGGVIGGRFYRTKWHFSDAALVPLLMLGYFCSIHFLLILTGSENSLGFKYFAAITLFLIEIAVPLWFLHRRPILPKIHTSFFKKISHILAGIFLYPLLLVSLIPLAHLIESSATRFLPEYEPESISQRLNILMDDNLGFQLFMCIAALTIVPVCEEIFFRGFLYNALRVRLPRISALITQAFIFAIAHPYTATYPFYIFWIAMGLGCLYEWRKYLITPIITHACINFGGTTLVLFLTWMSVLIPPPASNAIEAEMTFNPPPLIIDTLREIERSDIEAEELFLAIKSFFGPQGLDHWQSETVVLQALAEAIPDKRHISARARLEVARLFWENGDLWRADQIARKTVKEYADLEEVASAAHDLVLKIKIDLLKQKLKLLIDESGDTEP